jgi:hypothetical protein
VPKHSIECLFKKKLSNYPETPIAITTGQAPTSITSRLMHKPIPTSQGVIIPKFTEAAEKPVFADVPNIPVPDILVPIKQNIMYTSVDPVVENMYQYWDTRPYFYDIPEMRYVSKGINKGKQTPRSRMKRAIFFRKLLFDDKYPTEQSILENSYLSKKQLEMLLNGTATDDQFFKWSATN